MSAAPQGPIIIHADEEHGGIRLVVFISLFIGYLLGFQLVRWLLTTLAPPSIRDYTTFLACIGALPLAVLIIWALENLLKRIWHSGLSLELNSHGILARDTRAGGVDTQRSNDPRGDEPAIQWDGNPSQLNWYFRLSGYPRGGRERRMPSKWLCLATEFHQDGARLNVYAFMPPERATPLIENPRHGFHRVNPAVVYATSVRSRFGPPSRPTISNELLHSKDGRYWLAERRRWEYGIELSARDFLLLIDYAQARMRPESSLPPVATTSPPPAERPYSDKPNHY